MQVHALLRQEVAEMAASQNNETLISNFMKRRGHPHGQCRAAARAAIPTANAAAAAMRGSGAAPRHTATLRFQELE